MTRFQGDINIEMIDDFLNPIGKPMRNIRILPESATKGRGIIETNDSGDSEDEYYVPFSMRDLTREHNATGAQVGELNTAYALKQKLEDFNDTSLNEDAKSQFSGMNSIVGSGMSQIESVTTFDGASTLMKRVAQAKFRPKNAALNLLPTNDLEDIDELSESNNKLNATTFSQNDLHVYQTYDFETHTYDPRLKITSHRQDIIQLIDAYPVCIIQGGTGCGKTTQVPQFILDHHAKKNEYCNIIITQPRRIAAISVSSRVANERGWDLGTVCGYQIGLDRKHISSDTRISYVTTGILLQKLITKEDINRYTHIILDEVHERDLDIDFCLLILKMILKSNTSIKVVLMSATIDCAKFSKYFSNSGTKFSRDAPVKNIDGATYEVKEYYLEDLYKLGIGGKELPQFDYDDPKILPEVGRIVIDLLKYFDQEEKRQIQNNPKTSLRIIQDLPELRGSVLIFVPGMAQIQVIEEVLREKMANSNLYILPLHSDIIIDQQKRVFEAPQPTRRKVIISTRIAESSITVADVKYVIDLCLTKELWCDPYTNYTHLRMEWASTSSLNQRKGRAGRVSDGACYRLITREFFQKFEDQPIPQMLREPLHRLVLNVKRMNLKNKDPKMFLAHAIQPPNLDNIDRTILLLKETGALTLHPSVTDGELTYVGKVMANLPIDTKLSKLILLGNTFGKLRECIIIAAALSTKTFFVRYFKSNLEAFRSQWFWAQGEFCDCLTILNAYNLWEDYQQKGTFARREDMERWAKSNMIDLYRLREVRELKNEIEKRLKEFKIECNRNVNERKRIYEREGFRTGDDYDIDDENDVERNNLILKILIAGAFYPNYFQSSINDEYDVSKMVSGKDYRQTVMIKGLPMKQGVLYHYPLTDMFQLCSKLIQIHYEDTKAYIEFKSDSDVAKTKINFGVYMAIQMRMLKVPLELRCLKERIASEMMNEFNAIRRQKIEYNEEHKQRQKESIVYRLANTYYEEGDADYVNEEEELNKSRFSLASTTRQLNSFMITPTSSKLIEKLSNPENLLKKLNQFPIIITEVVECGNFWAQINEGVYKQTLSEIQQQINNKCKLVKLNPVNLCIGMLVITPFSDEAGETFLYRARIIDLKKDRQLAEVIFVDYGNKELKRFSQLYQISEEVESIQFQAIQCKLINIESNRLKCPNGVWTPAAKEFFIRLINDRQFTACVYSIVDNIVRVHLTEREDSAIARKIDLSDELIKAGFAVAAEESHMSRQRNVLLTKDNNNNHSQMKHSDSLVSLDLLRDEDILVRGCKKLFNTSDDSKYDGKIKLTGPYSPLEVTYHSITNIGKGKSVRIERDSINYVTLDDDPQNQFERMMVASQITLSHTASSTILRGTTLMPKIRGLTNIICLLFSPTCEVRLSSDRKSFTGALCGLGFDKNTKQPYYIDNDIECTFDTKFGFEEFKMINAVRMAMNMVIGSEEEADKWTADPRLLRSLQQKACTRLLALIEKERTPIEKKYFLKYGRWNQLKEHQIVDIIEPGLKFEKFLYSCHNVAVLDDDIE